MSIPEQTQESQKYFEVYLTMNQLEVIAQKMPLGYSLQFSKPIGTHSSRHTKNQKKQKSLGGENKPQQIPSPSNSQFQQLQLQPRQSLRKTQQTGQNFTQYNKLQTFGSNQKPRNNTQLQQILKNCYKILTQIKKNESAAPFLYPVNPQRLGIPDYFDIIKHPMDLSTVDRKLRQGIYNNEKEFQQDIKLIWNNSYMYNMKGSDIYLMTREMEQAFDKLFAEKFQNPENYAQLQQTVTQLQNKLNQMAGKNDKFSKNKSKVKSKQEFDSNKLRPLTFEEKQALGQKIRNLSSIYFEGILEIVSSQTSSKNQDNIEFDINKLPTKIARELEKYVNDKLGKQNKKDLQNNGKNSQQQMKMSKSKQNKGGNQYQKMQQQQPIEQIAPEQALHYQDEQQQQQKLYEQRMEVHQQMMKLKQQQALSLKQTDNNMGSLQTQQQQYIPAQIQQQFQAQQQQLVHQNQNPLIKQNQISNYQNAVGQIPMQNQVQDDEDKKSMSSYLTDSEDDSI